MQRQSEMASKSSRKLQYIISFYCPPIAHNQYSKMEAAPM